MVSLVYAFNPARLRKNLWKDVVSLSHSISSKSCLLGDFNAIKSLTKSEGGDDSWDSGMTDSKTCLDNIGVDDIQAYGPFHTWLNCQENNPITRKLDRAMGNGY